MAKTHPSLIELVTTGDPNLIDWEKVSKGALQRAITDCPSFLEDLVEKNIWASMPLRLQRSSLKNQTRKRDKVIHFMIRRGEIKTIPNFLLDTDILSQRGEGGETVFHILAKRDEMRYTKGRIWTKSILLDKDDSGTTPLHSMAMHGNNLILERDLKTETLLISNAIGETPLYNWASSTLWLTIPDKHLTKESLQSKGKYGSTILDIILEQHTVKPNWGFRISHSLEKILEKIDKNELKRLLRDYSREPKLNVLIKKEMHRRIMQKIKKDGGELEI